MEHGKRSLDCNHGHLARSSTSSLRPHGNATLPPKTLMSTCPYTGADPGPFLREMQPRLSRKV